MAVEHPIVVQVVRTGGFAGTRLERTIRSDQLDDADARVLEQLVAGTGTGTGAARDASNADVARDAFQYRININGNESVAAETNLAASERALIELAMTKGN